MPLVDYGQLPVLFAVLLVSVAVHEAAHAWSADLLGDPTPGQLGRVSLSVGVHADLVGTLVFPLVSYLSGHPFAGWGKPFAFDVRQLGPRWRSRLAIIAAAGPVANLLLAVVAAGLIRLGAAATGSGFDGLSAPLLFRAVDLNVLLATISLLPVPPLDGGTALAGLLPASPATVFGRMRPWGPVILFVLMLSGVLRLVIDPIRSALVSFLL